LEDDAIDFIIDQLEDSTYDLDALYDHISTDFEYGLKLVQEKTGKNRFFITKDALVNPESFISNLIKNELNLHLKTDLNPLA
jgi:RNAse (barnase) inhibitor barstar